MLDLLKQDVQQGDSLNLYLVSGITVKGIILEINENYLLMEVGGIKRRYFPQMIGGWDIVNDNTLPMPIITSNEQPADVEEEDDKDEFNDVLVSLFDKIYENEHINIATSIKTNATVDKVLPIGVSVVTDMGEHIICHKGFMAGFSRANCTSGKRLFCGVINNTGAHKGFCYLSVLQMTFEEMRERFILALTAKTGPRKPIINSIVAYFRNNNNEKTTKKIINDLRNKVSLLGSSGKVGNTELDKYISIKQYDKAFEYIENSISSCGDDKQKAALLLRKAQLYSSLKEYENAINAYRELISFNEKISSPSKALSHFYTELARLLHLIGDKEQAESVRNIALMLNPQNSIARKMNGFGNNIVDESDISAKTTNKNPKENINCSQIVRYIDKSLIDDDIDNHKFTDSEIVSLNGEVSIDIANRLLESASASDNYGPYIEAAKALRSLPIGSYDIQDLEDSITNYSLFKYRSLFNSYKKVVFESDSLNSISRKQKKKIKDCAICYSLEVIDRIIDEDTETASKILTDCLLLECSSLLMKHTRSKEVILESLSLTTNDLVSYCVTPQWTFLVPDLFVKLVAYSIQCTNLWDTIICVSPHFSRLLSYINENLSIKEKIIGITPKRKNRDINDIDYINVLRRYIGRKMDTSYRQLTKIKSTFFDFASIRLLQTRCGLISKKTYIWCFNDTDKKSIVNINHLVSLLSLYHNKNEGERKDIISNVLQRPN